MQTAFALSTGEPPSDPRPWKPTREQRGGLREAHWRASRALGVAHIDYSSMTVMKSALNIEYRRRSPYVLSHV